MILTHGANSLERDGGNIVYEFNLNSFNTSTLKDGNVQWHNFGARPVSLEKSSGALNITFTSGSKQFFGFSPNELNIGSDNFSVEVEYDSASYPYTSYLFVLYGVYICAQYTDVLGIWTNLNNTWRLEPSFNNSPRINIKCFFTRTDGYFKLVVYRNGSYAGETSCNYNFDGTYLDGTNTDFNGSSSTGTIQLLKYVVKRDDYPLV
jgi:hypothetical protein